MAPPEAPASSVAITVVYALPERQSVVALNLPEGTTAGEAVARSCLPERYPEIAARPLKLAIFGRHIAETATLKAGDRVEILRPLVRDPKETRRQLAARGRTMGRPQPKD